MMSWERLIEHDQEILSGGMLLKFRAELPFEGEVVMMICYNAGQSSEEPFSLITISGHKAGINPYVVFPAECNVSDSSIGLRKKWLVENWNKWVWPEGSVNEVWLRSALTAAEL